MRNQISLLVLLQLLTGNAISDTTEYDFKELLPARVNHMKTDKHVSHTNGSASKEHPIRSSPESADHNSSSSEEAETTMPGKRLDSHNVAAAGGEKVVNTSTTEKSPGIVIAGLNTTTKNESMEKPAGLPAFRQQIEHVFQASGETCTDPTVGFVSCVSTKYHQNQTTLEMQASQNFKDKVAKCFLGSKCPSVDFEAPVDDGLSEANKTVLQSLKLWFESQTTSDQQCIVTELAQDEGFGSCFKEQMPAFALNASSITESLSSDQQQLRKQVNLHRFNLERSLSHPNCSSSSAAIELCVSNARSELLKDVQPCMIKAKCMEKLKFACGCVTRRRDEAREKQQKLLTIRNRRESSPDILAQPSNMLLTTNRINHNAAVNINDMISLLWSIQSIASKRIKECGVEPPTVEAFVPKEAMATIKANFDNVDFTSQQLHFIFELFHRIMAFINIQADDLYLDSGICGYCPII